MAAAGARPHPVSSPIESCGRIDASIPSLQVAHALLARRVILVLIDLLSIWSSAVFAVAVRLSFGNASSLESHVGFLLLYSVLIVLSCNTQKLYSGIQFRSSKDETIAVGRAVGLASMLVTAVIYATGLKRWLMISRFVVALTLALSVVALAGTRYLRRKKLQNAVADGFICRNILIVGTGAVAQTLYHQLKEHRYLGYVAAGFLRADSSDPGDSNDVLGSIGNLAEIARARFIDEVIISTDNRAAAKLAIAEGRACGLGVRVIPDLFDGLAWGAPVEYVGQFPALCLHEQRIPALALMMKRGVDFVCSGIGLLVLCPLLVAIAAVIKLESPGPIFYTADRVGKKGRIFGCHKFRTMVRDADRMRAQLQHLNERDGVLFKISNDPRVTCAGKFLRKYSLDELPQLWNVLKGDMSLVGPRPPIAAEVRQYQLDHLKRLNVMPGITGLWQVEARTNPSFASYIALDIEYVDRWNLFLDFRILLKTASVVFAGSGR